DVRTLPGWSARFTLIKEHLLPDAAYMRRTYASGSSAPPRALDLRPRPPRRARRGRRPAGCISAASPPARRSGSAPDAPLLDDDDRFVRRVARAAGVSRANAHEVGARADVRRHHRLARAPGVGDKQVREAGA